MDCKKLATGMILFSISNFTIAYAQSEKDKLNLYNAKRSEASLCYRNEIPLLDDGISPASEIARAVVNACKLPMLDAAAAFSEYYCEKEHSCNDKRLIGNSVDNSQEFQLEDVIEDVLRHRVRNSK